MSSVFRSYVSNANLLWPIVALSLILNLWGIRWGAPASWHPDEITHRAISMVADGRINPHHFAYGGLHYYVLGLGAVVPVYILSAMFDPPPPRTDAVARARWWQPKNASIVTVARAISAVMSTAVVFFTFVIARVLFGRQAAYLSAFFLSVSMPFVAVAHFATVDAPANFWYWLSCLYGLLLWRRPEPYWFLLAAITAGFAIGIKLDRLVVLFPLAVALFLRGDPMGVRKVSAFIGLICVGYLLANPAIFTAFFEFGDGVTRDLFYNALRKGPDGSSYGQIVHSISSGLGVPLFVLGSFGLIYGLWDLVRRKNVASVLWLLATIVPYFILFGSMGVQEWYIPFFLPAVMVFAGRLCIDLLAAFPEQRVYFAASLIGVAVYSLLNTLSLNLQFSNDGRYAAAEWIDANVPDSATIEVGERGPSLSEDKYRIRYSRRDAGSMNFALEGRERLENHLLYMRIRHAILDLERWAERTFGIKAREQPYMAWFDNPHYREETLAESHSLAEADYVVLIEDLNATKVQSLTSQGFRYRLAARFQSPGVLGIYPNFPFVNPAVYVFQRANND